MIGPGYWAFGGECGVGRIEKVAFFADCARRWIISSAGGTSLTIVALKVRMRRKTVKDGKFTQQSSSPE
jgi:hypothetical protein